MLQRISILVLMFMLPLFVPSAKAVVATPSDAAPAAKENKRGKLKLRDVFKMMRTVKKHKRNAPRTTAMNADGPKNIMLAGMSAMLLGGIIFILAALAFGNLPLAIVGGAIAGLGLLTLIAGMILLIIGKKKK